MKLTDEIVDGEKEFTYSSSNFIKIPWNDWDWVCRYEIIWKGSSEREARQSFEYAKHQLLNDIK